MKRCNILQMWLSDALPHCWQPVAFGTSEAVESDSEASAGGWIMPRLP